MALLCDICDRPDVDMGLGGWAYCRYDDEYRTIVNGNAVGPVATTTVLTIADTTVSAAANVDMTATVSSTWRTPTDETGVVEFFADAVSLGTANLVDGVATKSDSTPAAGTYDYTAVYSASADGVHATSTSNVVEVTIS